MGYNDVRILTRERIKRRRLSSYGIWICEEAEHETKTQAHATPAEAGITGNQ